MLQEIHAIVREGMHQHLCTLNEALNLLQLLLDLLLTEGGAHRPTSLRLPPAADLSELRLIGAAPAEDQHRHTVWAL